MAKQGWPGPVRNLEELRALCEQLMRDLPDHDDKPDGTWFWNGYSGICTSLPKAHPLDDTMSIEEVDKWNQELAEAGKEERYEVEDHAFGWPISVNQARDHEDRGDELHHPIPRRVAKFLDVCDPAFVLKLIDGTANKAFDEELLEENEHLRGMTRSAQSATTAACNELRELREEVARIYSDERLDPFMKCQQMNAAVVRTTS